MSATALCYQIAMVSTVVSTLAFAVSLLALVVSATTGWLTLLRLGTNDFLMKRQ